MRYFKSCPHAYNEKGRIYYNNLVIKKDVITVNSQPLTITELDEKTSGSTAQMLKAAIPYATKESAKYLALMARFMELKSTFDYFSRPDAQLSMCSGTNKPSPEEMLSDLKKYCEPAQAEMVDKMLGMIKMGKFYEKYKELEQSPEFMRLMNSFRSDSQPSEHHQSDTAPNMSGMNNAMNAMNQMMSGMNGAAGMNNPAMLNNLKSMLTPEQQQMFETLMTMNKNNGNS